MLGRLALFAVLAALLVVPSAASAATIPPEPGATALVHTPPTVIAAAVVHPKPAAVRSHRAVGGDTLWWLSDRYCGTPLLFGRLAAANRVANPNRIYAGVVYRMDCRAGVQGTPATPARTRPRTTAPRATAPSAGWVYPLSSRGTCTSGYGYRVIYVGDRRHASFHQGVDISAPYGRTIRAVTAGTVVSAGWNSGYGRQVVLRHGGSSWTSYNHASSLLVHAGQRVGKGQAIARVGSTGLSTGNHLHVEVWTAWKDRTSPIPAFRAHGVRLC